jgi:hypothetical protein
MSFGDALEILKAGGRVQRSGWVSRGLWLELRKPEHEAPFIAIECDGAPLTDNPHWRPSQLDLLTSDWLEKTS